MDTLAFPVVVIDIEEDAVTPPESVFRRIKCAKGNSVLVQLVNGGHPSITDLCRDSYLI